MTVTDPGERGSLALLISCEIWINTGQISGSMSKIYLKKESSTEYLNMIDQQCMIHCILRTSLVQATVLR